MTGQENIVFRRLANLRPALIVSMAGILACMSFMYATAKILWLPKERDGWVTVSPKGTQIQTGYDYSTFDTIAVWLLAVSALMILLACFQRWRFNRRALYNPYEHFH